MATVTTVIETSMDWPAWAQAILSVMAIWVAGRTARRPQLAARAERTAAVCGVTGFAARVIGDARRAAEGVAAASVMDFDDRRIEHALRLVRSVEPMAVGSTALIEMMAELEERLVEVQGLMAAGRPHWLGGPMPGLDAQLLAAEDFALDVNGEGTRLAIAAAGAERRWLVS